MKTDPENLQEEFDIPWKGLVECFPRGVLRLAYPETAARFDWSVEPVNLQQELDSFDLGQRRKGIVDSLIELRTLEGDTEIVLCHAELHNRSMGFEKRSQRMLDYWMPIYARKRQPIVPLLLFTHTGGPKELQEPIPGEAATLKRYSIRALGGGVDFYYHAEWIKNIIERCGEDFFETSADPAAVFIHAHLKTLATRGDFELRAEEKFQLLRRMKELGLSEKEAMNLHRLVARVMKLPDDLDLQVNQRVLGSTTRKQRNENQMELTVDLGESSYEKALKAKIQAELEPRIKAELEAKIQAELEAKIQAELEPRMQAELEAKMQAELEARMLATQMEKKFGIPKADGIEKIKHLTEDQLEEFLGEILNLASIEDLEKWLGSLSN